MSTEWEEIARRELAEHQRRFFEEAVEAVTDHTEKH